MAAALDPLPLYTILSAIFSLFQEYCGLCWSLAPTVNAMIHVMWPAPPTPTTSSPAELRAQLRSTTRIPFCQEAKVKGSVVSMLSSLVELKAMVTSWNGDWNAFPHSRLVMWGVHRHFVYTQYLDSTPT